MEWMQPGVLSRYAQHGQELTIGPLMRGTVHLPDPVEVQDTIWVPLEFMQQDGVESLVPRPTPDGATIEVPALVYGGKTIWGLTYRMLREFLELIAEK